MSATRFGFLNNYAGFWLSSDALLLFFGDAMASVFDGSSVSISQSFSASSVFACSFGSGRFMTYAKCPLRLFILLFSDFLRLPLFFTDMLVFLLFPLNYLQSDINFINNLRMSWIYFKIQVDPGFLQVIDFKIQVDPCVYTGHWFTSTLIWKAAFTFSVFIGEIKKERIVHGLSY